MQFLQRLENEGWPNLNWHPRAKELIDVIEQRKEELEMDRTQLRKSKSVERKPRPQSLISGRETLTKSGIRRNELKAKESIKSDPEREIATAFRARNEHVIIDAYKTQQLCDYLESSTIKNRSCKSQHLEKFMDSQ